MRLFPEDSKIAALRRVPLFGGLDDSELELLARISEDMEVEAGKVLAREGDTGAEFFVIIEGEAEVARDGRVVRTEGPGDFFGEIALLLRRPRGATVTAKTQLRFFVLTSRAFRSLVERNPQVAVKVLSALAERFAADLDDLTR